MTSGSQTSGGRGLSAEQYVEGVRGGDVSVLGRAITLVESDRARDREPAQQMLAELLPFTGASHRIGISGVPGVGKSTFIDAFGTLLTGQGHRVGVLAVDPSSAVSGGSILGDKTRMPRLSKDPRAFIRPSPSGGTLGGVARKTRESILVCEAAGFDVVLVETVGVGQSEMVVADMVDSFLLLLLAGAGDELQGIKRGILELADVLAVNKADGGNLQRATQARREYALALKMMRGAGDWQPPVLACSGLEGTGLDEVWEALQRHRRALEQSGELERKRQQQKVQWMWRALEDRLLAVVRGHPKLAGRLDELEQAVREGTVAPTAAADELLALLGVDGG